MKLLQEFKQQLKQMGKLKRVWLTTFNLDIAFVEGWVLPAILEMDAPVGRMDYEGLQQELIARGIDFRIYCDPRMMALHKPKRTSVAVYPVSIRQLAQRETLDDRYLDGESSLFHPKVFYLEDDEKNILIGAGSANLTLSGWGRNQEAVDFRWLSSNAQYQQVKTFFTQLDERLNSDEYFPVRRKFYGEDTGWSFIHSLDGSTLMEALTAGEELQTLSVWSPYLAGDLATLVNQLRGAGDVELVPDLVDGLYMRTRWDQRLQQLIDDDTLSFYRSPVPRCDRAPGTHAKLWLAKSGGVKRLAVGSWNFTVEGCSSLAQPGRNIEAGIVHPVASNVSLCCERWQVGEGDFASEQLLEEEQLNPPALPPCDLSVIFDWALGEYQVSGQWSGGQPETGYQLILPGVSGPCELHWQSRSGRLRLPSLPQTVRSEALLDTPFYTLRCAGKADWLGMIIEHGAEHRRALSFASLDDLLNSYLSSEPATSGDRLLLRAAGGEDELQGEGEGSASPLASVTPSYFRLFQATQQRRNWLAEEEDGTTLHRWLFSDPGCLQELSEMARTRVEQSANPVFDWFLAQEVNSLVALSRQRVKKIRQKQGAAAIAVAGPRWLQLQVPLPVLKGKAVSLRYLATIREECGYGE